MRNLTIREHAGLVAVVLALVVMGLGAWLYRQQTAVSTPARLMQITPPGASTEVLAHSADNPAPARQPSASDVLSAEQPAREITPQGTLIVVHVAGAVKRPDVYTLRDGDRIYNAIQKAGGFKDNAAKAALNLADRVKDGDQIYVPSRTALPEVVPPSAGVPNRVRPADAASVTSLRPSSASTTGKAADERPRGRVLGRPPAPVAPAAPSVPPSLSAKAGDAAPAEPETAKFKNPGEGFVNINTAGAEELQRLPRVGPAMAERILAYRREIGRFSAPEQLMDVRGIGEKTFALMQPFVRVE